MVMSPMTTQPFLQLSLVSLDRMTEGSSNYSMPTDRHNFDAAWLSSRSETKTDVGENGCKVDTPLLNSAHFVKCDFPGSVSICSRAIRGGRIYFAHKLMSQRDLDKMF